MGHHVDRVDLGLDAVLADRAGLDLFHHGIGHAVAALAPRVDHLVVLFLLGDQAVLVLLLVIGNQRLGLLDHLDLLLGDDHVILTEGDAGLERVAEAERHDRVGEQHRVLLAGVTIDLVDNVGDVLLGQQAVDDVERNLVVLGQTFAYQHPAGSGLEPLHRDLAIFVGLRNAGEDLGVQRNLLGFERLVNLGHVREHRQLLDLVAIAVLDEFGRLFLPLHREVVETQNHVLRRHDDRLAVGGREDVVGRHHQHACFELRLEAQRHVNGHLVAVEVGVVGRADQRVQLDRLAFDQHGFECLDAETVKRRRAVQQDRVFADDFIQDVPDFLAFLLDPLLRLLQGHRETLGVEPGVDERLEQFERHLLGQAALVQLEFGAGHDDRTARIVDALAEQVLAEAALLALEHVGQRLERTLVRAGDHPAAAAIVEQRIDRFLQHALFVAHDDVGRAQFHQALEAVVAVDDAAIEVVEIRRREAAAVERHQRAQFGRDDRYDFEDHPFGAVARFDEAFDDLQTLDDLGRLELGLGGREVFEQVFLFLFEIEIHQHGLDRFGADVGGEGVFAILVLRLEQFIFGEELELLERGQAGLGDDVAFEIQHALELLELHVEQQADARRQRLEEPDVRYRCGQFDMAHAFAADLGHGHFDAALLADDALVLHALVLAAQAFVVLHGTEDAGTEQAVTFGLERPVVDRFRLLDFAEGPRANALGAGDADLDLVESFGLRELVGEFGQFVHDLFP